MLLWISAGVLWLTFPLVTLSAKCFLTSVKCSRWGPDEGSDFHYPLTAATLHLLIVGGSLLVLIALTHLALCWQRDTNISLPNDVDAAFAQERFSGRMIKLHHLRRCSAVGVAFGIKYVVAHWALQVTPAAVYELFHCINILFVALLAHFLLGERLTTWGDVGCCLGIVVGSAMASQQGFEVNGKVSMLALSLNIVKGLLAGTVVVLLRWTMLPCSRRVVVQVTAYKMVMGAAALIPFAIVIEGLVILSLTSKQLTWLCISSWAIFVYHVNLSLLCWLASAPTVGILEALRPVPAFVGIALLQKMYPKNVWFWMGTVLVLVSVVGFGLSRNFRRVDERNNVTTFLLERCKIRNQSTGRPESTEFTLLVDDHKPHSVCCESTTLLPPACPDISRSLDPTLTQ